MTTAAKIATPTVFLIAQPMIQRRKKPPNLKPLYEHGEVQVIIPTSDSPTFNAQKCYEMVENRLAGYDPEVDFLVWAGGDTLAALMAGMYLGNEDIWRFRWLRYERHRLPDGSRTDEGAKYVPVIIDLEDPQSEIDSDDTED